MTTPAIRLAALLNVTTIDATRSPLHGGLRQAEIATQATLIEKLAASINVPVEDMLAEAEANTTVGA